MKSLLIFISPTNEFSNPDKSLTDDFLVSAKIQIDNNLELGWNKKDILFYTNFDFEHAGIKSIVLDGVEYFKRKPQATKINAIIKLFENGLIQEDETYWFHDLDAFQMCEIKDIIIELNDYDIALSDYGFHSRWSTGVMYFNHRAKDIFYEIQRVMYRKGINEEIALTKITDSNEKIRNRIKKINKSYNYTPKHIKKLYPNAIKPICVAHLHPFGVSHRGSMVRSYDFFNGENDLGVVIMTKRLKKIFNKHGIK